MITTKAVLKSYFNTGDIPIESNFVDLIDSCYPSTRQPCFDPADYGNDVQDAIDAASAAGGGIVALNGGTFTLTLAGSTQIGMYNTDYGLWVNHDNVFIEGPGTFILAVKPATTRYTAILFGNGGASGSWPLEAGTWTYHVGIRGVIIDATALSDADRDDITHAMSGGIMFAYCQYYFAEQNIIKDAWGFGGIHSNVCSRYGIISGNRILDCIGNAFAAEGGRYLQFVHNYIKDCSNNAIEFNANLDNDFSGVAYKNIVANNMIDGFATGLVAGYGIKITGMSDSILANNHIRGDLAHCYGIGMTANAALLHAKAEVLRNAVTGNYFYCSITANPWIYLRGVTANPFDGTDLTVANNHFTNNTVIGFIKENLGDHVINNNIIDNNCEFYSAAAALDATCTGNRLFPNTQPVAVQLTQNSATPNIGYALVKTNNNAPTTITAFTGGYAGAKATVLIKDAVTTIDFTGTILKGNGGADWSPANGDFMDCIFDGTNWFCDVHDAT